MSWAQLKNPWTDLPQIWFGELSRTTEMVFTVLSWLLLEELQAKLDFQASIYNKPFLFIPVLWFLNQVPDLEPSFLIPEAMSLYLESRS